MPEPIKEYTIIQIKDLLRRMPDEVHAAGQERIKAGDALIKLQAQLKIEESQVRIRIYETNPDIKTKILESYVVLAEEVRKFSGFVIEAMQILEVKKLEEDFKNNKNLAIRKIANINDTYQM